MNLKDKKKKVKRAQLFLIIFMCTVLIFIESMSKVRANTIVNKENIQTNREQVFIPPIEVKPTPINFINGSFENPSVFSSGEEYEGDNGPTDAEIQTENLLHIWNTFNMEKVDGWSTTPVKTSEESGIFQIEIQQGYLEKPELGKYMTRSQDFAERAADGKQYAELNARVEGRLYQNISTTPGTHIYWSFKHRARNYNRYGETITKDKDGNITENRNGKDQDVLNFYLRAAGTHTTAPNEKTIEDGGHLVYKSVSNELQWYERKGIYTIPEGQYETEFSYESVSSTSGSKSYGNYLDDIKFQTGSSLIAEKSIETSFDNNDMAYKGEEVTISVDITNWGENDASEVIFNDILSNNLEYVGKPKVNGNDVSASFNEDTNILQVNIGIIKGSQNMGTTGNVDSNLNTGRGETVTVSFKAKVIGNAGEEVLNQAHITYNDSGFEEYNNEGFKCYSHVKGKVHDDGKYTENDKEDYINKFVIVDRSINGTLWIDNNEDGNISLTDERTVVGLEVVLLDIDDNIVKDINGKECRTITDENGYYEILAIPPGKYKVVIDTIENYKVSSVVFKEQVTLNTGQTEPNNNALEHNNRVVTSEIDMSADFVINSADGNITEYKANHIDFGIIPTMAIEKESVVNGNTEIGTDTSPVEVQVGDIIEYTINVTNEASNENDKITKQVSIIDELPLGLEYIDAKGYIAEIENGQITTQNSNEGRTKVIWTPTHLNKGDSNKLKISAKVVDQRNIFINRAILKDKNEQIQSNETFHETKVFDFNFIKIDAESKTPLTGVKFELYKCKINEEHNHSNDLINQDNNCWDISNSITVVSNKDGVVEFNKLTKGTYMLVEVETLKGYQLPQGKWIINISEDKIDIHTNGDTLPPAFIIENNDGSIVYKLPNYKSLTTPMTGGRGVLMFNVMGIAFIGISIIIAITSSSIKKLKKN